MPPIKSAREPWLADGAATTDLPRVGTVLQPGSIGVEAMHDHRIPSEAARRAHDSLPEPFDGYPYLVTRIGQTALRHLAVLPADWSRERLLDVARRQATA